MLQPKQPPHRAQQFLRWFCDPDLLPEIEGDMFEMYQRWVKNYGWRRAKWLYFWNVITFLRFAIRKPRPNTTTPMFKNYFFIAYRNLSKYKSFTLINVCGLAIGISAALIISMYAFNELTYDRFHPLAERIYLVYKERITPNGIQPTYDTWMPLTERLKSEFPEIEKSSRSFVDDAVVKVDEQQFDAETLYADPAFFDMFHFPLVQGNAENPFPTMHHAVITKKTAQKFFEDENPIGKTIMLDYEVEYAISGVLADVPQNSSLQFDMVVPIRSIPEYQELNQDWGASFLSSYVLLPDEAAARSLEAKFPAFVVQVYGEETQQRTNFRLLPFTASYDTFIGDSQNIYILLMIALGIILIASVNFMNLSTARSMERMREIGMRKTFGAKRSQLIYQFMSEAVLLSFAGMLMGVLLTLLILPYFNQKFGIELPHPVSDIRGVLLLCVFAIGLGVFSGSYPALFLSKFKIIQSLKGKPNSKQKGIGLRNVLVVAQFTASIFLIGCTLTVWQQLSFMQHADMAFDKENVVVMPIGLNNFEGSAQDSARLQIFKNQLLENPQVQSVTSSAHVPGQWSDWFTFAQPKAWKEDPFRVRYTYADAAYFQTLGIDFLEGRPFHEGSLNDREEAVIINEATLRAFGWNNIEGKVVTRGSSEFQVVGLVKDYHFESLRNAVAPMLHFYRSPENGVHQYVTARFQADDYPEMLSFIEERWNELKPGRPFEYSFMDEQVARMYETENQLLSIVGAFSGVAIAIACMGLLGLSQYTLQKRKKEIGIRKVLGASVSKILVMVGKDFTLLILVSLLIAIPFAYWLLNVWLEAFAYRIKVNLLLLTAVGSIALLIAWLTISFQSVSAAQANPVDSLRDE